MFVFCGGLDKSCSVKQLSHCIFNYINVLLKFPFFPIIWNWRDLLPTQIHLVKQHLIWQQKPRGGLTQKRLRTELQKVYSRKLLKIAPARREQTQRAFPHSSWQNRKKGLELLPRENLHQMHAICVVVIMFYLLSYLMYIFSPPWTILGDEALDRSMTIPSFFHSGYCLPNVINTFIFH